MNENPKTVERALIKIAHDSGYELLKISPKTMAQIKGESRQLDAELIKSGELTAAQVQSKNNMTGGKIEVIDWDPVFA